MAEKGGQSKKMILSSGELMTKILHALEHRLPCAVVSLGATESFVLAQETVLTRQQFMGHAEARTANLGLQRGNRHRGVRFPNFAARDALAEALQEVDIIGCNLLLNDLNSGQLTKKVLEYYNIAPPYIFEAYVRRVIMFSQKRKFEQMLRGKKIILVCGYADEVAAALNKNLKKSLNFNIVGAIKIHEFEEIPRAKKEIQALDFDLALLSAGLNAIILAAYIARVKGKVAFDIGQGMESLITGQIVDEGNFLNKTIGIINLLKL